MSEVDRKCDFNPLKIIEDEISSRITSSDNNSDDNESNGELFDFSDSEINALETVGSELSTKRNSLLIIEEKDLMMMSDDFNNNNSHHRLSLQVESGDENSLVMTNEAINRTIIRIGSNGSSTDFGEQTDTKAVVKSPHEAINHEFEDKSSRRNSENYADGGESIVSILGQINDIVGFMFCVYVFSCGEVQTGVGGLFILLSLIPFVIKLFFFSSKFNDS